MPLGIGFEPAAGLVDGDVLADAGDDILQRAPLGRVIEHVVDGDQRNAGVVARSSASRASRRAIVAAIEHAGGEPDASRREARFAAVARADATSSSASIRAGGMTIRLRPFDVLEQIVEEQDAFAFLGAPLAER